MAQVFEHEEGEPLAPGDTDGMADVLSDCESGGWEGEHVFDASLENPPHPFWNAKEGRCYTDEELAEQAK